MSTPTRRLRSALLALVTLGVLLPGSAAAIVNGTPADRAAFPYYTVVGGGTHCGGTLIAPDRVLTAAHCQVVLEQALTVLVGPRDEPRVVTKIAVHPQYVKYEQGPGGGFGLYPADLMILQLDRPVTDVAPLPIATAADGLTTPGEAVQIIGRGVPVNGQEPRDMIFRSATMQIVPDTRCGSTIGGAFRQSWSLCTLDPRGLTAAPGPGPFVSTCHGDSGGPLLAVKDGVTFTIGTVSGAEECGALTGDVFGDAVRGRAFARDPTPVWAPLATGRPVLRGSAREGRTLRCAVPWSTKPRRTFTEFDVYRNKRLVATPESTRGTLRVPRGYRGTTVSCSVSGFSAGGHFSTKQSPAVRIRR